MIDEQTKPRSSFWRELPILLGVAILVAIVVRAFVLQTFFIPSESMEHTLNINDRVLVNKLVYDFRSPHRGEVIVFTSPVAWRSDPNEKDFIKRVIGVGGDHIVCCDPQKRLIINGHAITEPYLNQDAGPGTPPTPTEPFEVTVPRGRLWVMGDNRYHSGDSRQNYLNNNHNAVASTISVNAVIGRAFVVFWPVSRAGLLSVPATFAKVPDSPGG